MPETKSFDYRLQFFKDHANKEVSVKAVAVRNDKNANYDPTSIHTYVLEEDFDYMQINRGVVLFDKYKIAEQNYQ